MVCVRLGYKNPSKMSFFQSPTRKLLLLLLLPSVISLGKGASPSNQNAEASRIIQELGFTAIRLPKNDFSLPSLNGGTRSLHDFRGRWVWLVFWATWCGPCNEEMPILETLHVQTKGSGVEIVGVSVDQTGPDALGEFVRSRGLHFTMLHDATGKVSDHFGANAIPSLFLITPDGETAGMYRGANRWEPKSVAALFHRLGKIKHYDPDTAPDLTPDLIPPKLKMGPLPSRIQVGVPFPLDVEVVWEGDSSQYLIKTPKLTVPAGVQLGDVRTSSSSKTGTAAVFYHYSLTASKEGKLALGPLELAYQSRRGGKELFARKEATEIEISPGVSATTWIVISGSAASVLGLLGFAFQRRKRITTRLPAEEKDSPAFFAEHLEGAKRLKLEGKKREFCLRLLELKVATSKARGENLTPWIQAQERARFGGVLPSDEELSRWERELEKGSVS